MATASDQRLTAAISILERLVAFESISGRNNLDLVAYVRELLQGWGIASHTSYDETGERANLHATVGPEVAGGVVLNGHTDVVPVEGQPWTSNPFELVRRDGRLYGRGSVDMKGFLACMLASVPGLKAKPLKRPIQVSVCYDEETGGFGAPVLVDAMGRTGPLPAVAIVGEPTMMRIISGHKGGFEMRTNFTGVEAHSSDPRRGVNAVHYAARFIVKLQEVAARLAANPPAGSPFDPPWTSINAGRISGGVARNITAGACTVLWDLRPVPGDDGDAIVEEIRRYAMDELLPEMRAQHEGADIAVITDAAVPALDYSEAEAAVALVAEITGRNSTEVVSFGTDAGHFCAAGISTIVFGPGSIDQAHRPDEFVEIDQLAKCLDFIDRLGDRLAR